MKTPLSRATLLPAMLAVLAACGGDDAGAAAGDGAAAGPQVYTSEVESVSRWIREGGVNGAPGDLVAAPNPQGEGVIVYSRSADTASGGERAAWVVVDSQVVPLNRASRRATPGLQTREDSSTWRRIGIPRRGGEVDLRDILPVDPPDTPARPPAAQPAPREGDSAEARPAPPQPRRPAPRDTLHVPTDTAPPPARPDSQGGNAPPREPRDTLRIPAGDRPGQGTPPDSGAARIPAETLPEAAAA